MSFVSDAEWQAMLTPVPYVSGRTLTEAEVAEVSKLTSAIAYGLRDVHANVERFMAQPVTFRDLLAVQSDRDAAWTGWLDALRVGIEGVATARKGYTRLVALLGPDATVCDHGFAHGREHISLATIEDSVTVAEALVAPLAAVAKATRPVRRAAA